MSIYDEEYNPETDLPACIDLNREDLEEFGMVEMVEVVKVIRKEGSKWVLYDSSGKKKLGTHDTKAEAKAQETAIKLSKARKAGHKIPKT